MNLHSNLVIEENAADLKPLYERYKEVRQQTVDLCKPLKTEDYVVQPSEFASPPKWNLAHVSWFFETFVLKKYKKNYQTYDPRYAYFFNSYYESEGQRTFRADRGNMSRPTTEEVYQFRAYIDAEMHNFLENGAPSEAHPVIELGLHHEQQHQELLLTDLKYTLGNNPLFPAYMESPRPDYTSGNHLSQNFLEVEEGVYSIGYEGNQFFFDNEKGVHKVFLHAFQIQDRLISNEEYLEFMEAGGYQSFKYWLGPGWEWVKKEQIQAPLYWHKIDGEWHHYTLHGLEKIDLKQPVTHISFYEADAFADWKGKRLATEFEWEIACKLFSPKIPQTANFLESAYLHPIPKNEDNQFFGNAWEWTNSAYLPYPYYTQEEGALGEYNGKFMINQMVLRGGSCVTPVSHIRPTYRNFFYPQERWQFTGIRLTEHIA